MSYRFVLSSFTAMVVSTSSLAGDLNPPVGPVAETGRFGPRTEINPANTPGDADSLFRILQPGSYYMSGNITGVPGKHGIEISSRGVTIDLMGFELRGVVESLSGIRADGGRNDVTVRNGVVTRWGVDGIDLFGESPISDGGGLGSLIEAIHASSNVGVGIKSGISTVIRKCTSMSNGGSGIESTGNCVIESCVSRLNGGDGIVTGFSAVVLGCSARENGISGIWVRSSSAVTDCTAYANNLHGIVCHNGSTIRGNTLGSNMGDGIQADDNCYIVGNECHDNGTLGGAGGATGAGVHITGSDNCIERNHVTDNGFGIDVDSPGNLIVRNSAAGNSIGYDIVPLNTAGPIVTPANIGTSNNPHSNYQY